MSFVHLHTHSHYSLLDGLPKIPDLVARAKEFGCPALGLTDHGVMFGAMEFYKECKKQGIKPIVGMEAYMALATIDEKRAKVDDDYHHLTLLAKDEEGYRNLMQLASIAQLQGFYYKPRIDKNLLRQYGKGLIGMTGCLRGEIPRALARGDYEEAKRLTQEFQDIFGKENFYGEVQHHVEISKQKAVNQRIFKLAQELNMGVVATVDSHYLDRMDADAQDVLMCVAMGKFVTDIDRLDMRKIDLCFKSPDKMKEDWKDHPEVIENTLKVAERCNLELELDKWDFPKYPIPEGKTRRGHLREQVWVAAKERYGNPVPDEIQKRIEYELGVIEKTGYATYFLIVSDFVKWARAQGIIATTRGSAAGSIVSYLVDITTVDPLYFRLPFERFLTVSRPSPPDIDVDFADNRRDEVIEYVREKYGRDKVAQICTFGKMLPRAAVRDVTRVLGLPYSLGDKLAKLIPFGAQGFPMTVDRALEENPELAGLHSQDEQVKKILTLARKLEGCARHASVHAAGVVVAPTQLTDFTPLQREAKGDNIITQYDMHSVESAGLIKIDMLGIRNLSILGNAVEIVKHTKNTEVDIGQIPLDDKKIFKLLARGDTMGVFQLSGSGMTRYLRDLKPTSIHDIMAMVALYRPGPIDSIPEYIRRKNNPKQVSYLDPRLEPILERGFGILVYQDDVLEIAIQIAGYTWEEADKLRKAMGKKIPRQMAAQREKFLGGCEKNGMARVRAEDLWHLIEPFAAYGFNRSHAASYAMVAYQTAYMKAHFPAEFITAILTAESSNTDKLAEVIASTRESGITVLPPDVNESRKGFTYVDDTQIRFGMLAIKNLGSDVVEGIIKERDVNGPYEDLEDFLKRVQHKNLNKKSLESLVKSGAMDRFGDRGQMFENIETMLAFNREFTQAPTNQTSLFAALPETRKLIFKEVPPATKQEKLQWEKDLLGLYVTSHPLEDFREQLEGKVITSNKLLDVASRAQLCMAGVVTECKVRTTRNGEQMATGRLQDMTGSCEIVIFPKTYRQDPSLWQDGALLCVWGRGKGDEKRLICDRAMVLTRESVKDLAKGKLADSEPRKKEKPKSSERVVLTLQSNDRELLETLRTFLVSTSGSVPVYIVLNQGGNQRIIQTNFHINPSEAVMKSIESIVGAGGVKVVE